MRAFLAALVAVVSLGVVATPAAVTAQMVPVLLGGAPESLKVATEAQKFIDAPKNLTVSLKAKGAPLKAADFMGAGDPSAVLSKVDISAVANQ